MRRLANLRLQARQEALDRRLQIERHEDELSRLNEAAFKQWQISKREEQEASKLAAEEQREFSRLVDSLKRSRYTALVVPLLRVVAVRWCRCPCCNVSSIWHLSPPLVLCHHCPAFCRLPRPGWRLRPSARDGLMGIAPESRALSAQP